MTFPLTATHNERGVLIQSDFLSPQVCERLIRFFQENIAMLGVEDAVPAFAHRVISLSSLDGRVPDHAEVARIMRAVRFLVAQEITECFDAVSVLPEKTQLVV